MLLLTSLCTNLGLLFFFKYFNFFGETLTAFCRAISIPFSAPTLDIILPVGISFYTFQTLSYTIDVYRGKMTAERDFVMFALFVSYFPQLVAGPIEKASNLLPQLKKEHKFSYENASYGLKLMAWGFFKKLVIADRMAVLFVDPVYQNLESYHGGVLLVATIAFAIQIYCDFSGYSDIARGCAKTMGIELMVNFKAPYLATSVSEFWRKWHISLTSWFREYVYIPLGGSRNGLWKCVLATTVTFFLSGLWHGANWTFIVWGLIQAGLIGVERLFHTVWRPRAAQEIKRCPLCIWFKKLVSYIYTFVLCCFSWVFFRADTITDAFYVLRHCITGGKAPLQYCKNALLTLFPGEIVSVVLILSVLLLFVFDWINERRDPIDVVSAWPIAVRWTVYVGFILTLLLLIPKEITAPFIYFQF